MRACLIDQSGLVVNVALVDDGYVPPEGLSLGPPGGEIGWSWNGQSYVPPYVTGSPPTADDFAQAIQGVVDRTAASRGYGNGVALASYASSTIAQWAAEAHSFIAWRDIVWAYAYIELDKVVTGQRPMPTIEQIISELPPMVWP